MLLRNLVDDLINILELVNERGCGHVFLSRHQLTSQALEATLSNASDKGRR